MLFRNAIAVENDTVSVFQIKRTLGICGNCGSRKGSGKGDKRC
jgi:hypothetical protein